MTRLPLDFLTEGRPSGDCLVISISVTEKEIQQGILEAENSKQSCLWFRRTLSGIDNAKPSIVLSKFKGKTSDISFVFGDMINF